MRHGKVIGLNLMYLSIFRFISKEWARMKEKPKLITHSRIFEDKDHTSLNLVSSCPALLPFHLMQQHPLVAVGTQWGVLWVPR